MYRELQGTVEGEGGGLRVGGFSLPHIRGKSGRAFAPPDQKGDFQVSKGINLIRGERERCRKGRKGGWQ
jgi:hypothetical protein